MLYLTIVLYVRVRAITTQSSDIMQTVFCTIIGANVY